MDNYILTIKVNDGKVFEGSLNQWEDSFFSFPTDFSVNQKIEAIQDHCEWANWNLTLSWKLKK